jgi:polyhydroxybutyrate depolymerase
VPTTYDPARAHPLVINMPGHRVGHRELAGSTQLVRSAELNGFLLVFAGQEFREGRWAWWTDWDWQRRKAENPDFAFLRRIVETVAAEYDVDRSRVYLSGHSRGAAMALIAALELPDLVAGAAVESGFTEFGYLDTLVAAPARKVPLWFFHGTKDPDVCINCQPGARCNVGLRSCGDGMHATDAIVARLRALGWTDDELVYERLEGVTHRWQEQLNQPWWDFLSARPLPR